MILNFLAKILNATAQRHLKKQQQRELAALKLKLLGTDEMGKFDQMPLRTLLQ